MYKKILDSTAIVRMSDNATIVPNETNPAWMDYLDFLTAGGVVLDAELPPAENPVELAEMHIVKFFPYPRLNDLQQVLGQIPANNLINYPKLLQTFRWTQAVKQSAIAGVTELPEPPNTYFDVLSELASIN